MPSVKLRKFPSIANLLKGFVFILNQEWILYFAKCLFYVYGIIMYAFQFDNMVKSIDYI